MTSATPAAPQEAAGTTVAPAIDNPWERYGWVMAAIWLVFLVYPVVSVANSDRPTLAKVFAWATILAFGLVYTLAMNASWAFGAGRVVNWRAVGWLGVLALLSALTVPVLGLDAIGMTPFLMSFAIFTLPLRVAFPLAGLIIMATTAIPTAMGRFGEWAFFVIILAIVLVSTSITRIANDKEVDYTAAKESLRLAEERERVAPDVHDVLGHSLTVVSVKTELAERLLDVDVERARHEIAEIRAITRTALAEIRETVGGLRVASLADEVESARVALTGAGITPSLPVDLTLVDPRHRTVLAWTMREAVTNVVRHSRADHCWIELGAASLVVQDDGRGARGRREGNGIRGLRERVAGVGGSVSIQPGPDGVGTRVEVIV